MKKLLTVLLLLGCIVPWSCGPSGEDKVKEEAKVKTDRVADSLKEKSGVDSLFDVVGKNLDSAKGK